ncbi:NUDIX domain-containing protein [Candidatus Parcubacteria bacterium]|nr:MAG: NUDIX domain-containing protein [Candidatus Parcubacteria bacterium]
MPSEEEGKKTTPYIREISAGCIVFRRTQEGYEFLVLYHGHGYWNFPKGKIENEEKSLRAALRETREETGLTSRDLQLIPHFRAYERFTFRRGGRRVFKVVIFYLAETTKSTVRLSHEHQGYGWFSFREAKKILSKYRDSQRVLEAAFRFLRRLERGGRREKNKKEKSTSLSSRGE